MKTATIVATALLALAGSVHAQTSMRSPARAGTGLYGELGYTRLDLTGSSGGASIKANPYLLRGIVGYGLHPNVAVEALLGLGVQDDDFSGAVGGVPYSGDVRVRSTLGLFVKPRMDFGPVEVFARVGYAQTKLRGTAFTGGVGTTLAPSDRDWAFGAGVNWNFSPRTYVGLDLMRYYDRDQFRVDGVTASIGMRW